MVTTRNYISFEEYLSTCHWGHNERHTAVLRRSLGCVVHDEYPKWGILISCCITTSSKLQEQQSHCSGFSHQADFPRQTPWNKRYHSAVLNSRIYLGNSSITKIQKETRSLIYHCSITLQSNTARSQARSPSCPPWDLRLLKRIELGVRQAVP